MNKNPKISHILSKIIAILEQENIDFVINTEGEFFSEILIRFYWGEGLIEHRHWNLSIIETRLRNYDIITERIWGYTKDTFFGEDAIIGNIQNYIYKKRELEEMRKVYAPYMHKQPYELKDILLN